MGGIRAIVLLWVALVCVGQTIVWDPLQAISENKKEKKVPTIHYTRSAKTAHIFWEEGNDAGDLYLMYRTRLANSTLAPTRCLDSVHPLAYYENLISVQSTPDEQHILLAYGAYRKRSNKGCTTRNADSCIEVLFMESFDGGSTRAAIPALCVFHCTAIDPQCRIAGWTWTTPVRIKREEMEDTRHRSLPSMIYEGETGRVYIAYYIDMNAAMIVRQPNMSVFESEQRLSVYMFGRILHLGYTRESQKGLTWLHLVWYEDDLDRTKSILYSRSNDRGENWTKRKLLVEKYKGTNLPTLAVDNAACEGCVYVQYSNEMTIEALWTQNHGESWEPNIKMGAVFQPVNALAICGNEYKQGNVYSLAPGMGMASGFLKYFSVRTTIPHLLTYPFNGIKELREPALICSFHSSREVVLNVVAINGTESEVYFAQAHITNSLSTH